MSGVGKFAFPKWLLGTVCQEGKPGEYVIFVDHNLQDREKDAFNDAARVDAAQTWTADFIVETVHELGAFVVEGRISDTDADILIRHLDAELGRRL